MAGARTADGERYSVFEVQPGQSVAPIIASVMRRRAENLRDHISAGQDHALPALAVEPPGMPLGLPALSDTQVATLLDWIARGCPGPEESSGRSEVLNGYLIADGPVDDNTGCHVRVGLSQLE